MSTEIETPFATVEELRARWLTIPDFEDSYLEMQLLDASQYIADVCPSSLQVAAATRRRVVCAVVRRAIQAQESETQGIESWQQGAGPYQETIKPLNPHGDYYLTTQERKALGYGRQQAFSVDPLAGRS